MLELFAIAVEVVRINNGIYVACANLLSFTIDPASPHHFPDLTRSALQHGNCGMHGKNANWYNAQLDQGERAGAVFVRGGLGGQCAWESKTARHPEDTQKMLGAHVIVW